MPRKSKRNSHLDRLLYKRGRDESSGKFLSNEEVLENLRASIEISESLDNIISEIIFQSEETLDFDDVTIINFSDELDLSKDDDCIIENLEELSDSNKLIELCIECDKQIEISEKFYRDKFSFTRNKPSKSTYFRERKRKSYCLKGQKIIVSQLLII